MRSNKFKSHISKYILDKLSENHCYCKIRLSYLGRYVNFLLKDAQKVIETILELNNDILFVNNTSKIFGTIKEDNSDGIPSCGYIALLGKDNEQYSMFTRLCYRVTVFSPKSFILCFSFLKLKNV